MAFKKKILHFIESGGLYGAENVILNLSKEMIEDGQYEPVVGCIVYCKNEESELFDKAQSLNIKAIRIVINNKRFPLDILLAAFQLKRRKISLIHSHGYKPSIVGFIIRLLSGIPVIATCHLWFWRSDSPWKFKIMTKLEIFLYRFYPKVVTVSKLIKDYLIASGVYDGKIEIINNGIEIINHTCNDYNCYLLKQELKLKEDVPIVLNLGRLSEQKAQYTIILAAKALKERGRKIYFLIAGEGELSKYLKDQINKNSVNDEVKLLGFRDNVDDLLQLADIFLLPSLDEGLPICLLEAMANCKPIITTPVGAIPNVIKDGHHGIFVQVKDITAIVKAVEILCDDFELRQRIAYNGYIKIKKEFGSEIMFKKYKRIYNNINGLSTSYPRS